MGRHLERTMEKIKKSRGIIAIIVSALLVGALALFNQTSTQQNKNFHGAILPHHLLVQNYIDQFYEKLAKENPETENILIVSPNHIGYGLNYMQTTNNFDTFPLAIQPILDTTKIQQLLDKTTLHLKSKSFEKEHGIFLHLKYLKKYFPDAKLIPIILKIGTPQDRMDRLIETLFDTLPAGTLIIASIDFTHYENEEIAVKNDERTINWLKELKTIPPKTIRLDQIKKLSASTKQTNPDSVAFDSPESMYVMLKLLEKTKNLDFTLFQRTSTLSLTKLKNPLENTSHIFGEFN